MAHAEQETYFHRVSRLTPTRFWINNPTIEEAGQAIAAGAVSCTTNPTYSAKMLASETDGERARKLAREVLAGPGSGDVNEAARQLQRRLVAPILKLFLPVYEKSGGNDGFVSVQGDPFAEEDSDAIVDEALEDRKFGPNVIAKIPVTESGLAAMERLLAQDVPIIATEVMSIAQAIAVWELYRRVEAETGKRPPFYVTHITGIFDEHLSNCVRKDRIEIDPDILRIAGTAVARKQLRIMRERSYPGIVLGGGARGLHHFTEFVGEPMHVTINWKGTAEELIKADNPVVSRAGCPVPSGFVDELQRQIPDFRKAYVADGLRPAEFKDFGPVVLFRNSFQAGWQKLLDELRSGTV